MTENKNGLPATSQVARRMITAPRIMLPLMASWIRSDAHSIANTGSCFFSRLSRVYRFWLDPWEERKIVLSDEVGGRLSKVFELLHQALRSDEKGSELAIAYLNVVMSELEHAYFSQSARRPSSRSVDSYVRFHTLVEKEFARQPLVSELASELAMSESRLYAVVKEFSGFRPRSS